VKIYPLLRHLSSHKKKRLTKTTFMEVDRMKTNESKQQQAKKAEKEHKLKAGEGNPKLSGPDRPST
jgi:hypothetical protein